MRGDSIPIIIIAILNSNCLVRILAEKFNRELNVGFLGGFLEYSTVVKTLEKRSE